MVEADILAGGSINSVPNGHKYNRSLRCHKLHYEALSRLQVSTFLEHNPDLNDQFADVAQTLLTSLEFNITESLDLHIRSSKFVETQCANNPLFHFWNNYLTMVKILLIFIRATRESDWCAHVDDLCFVLPYFYALH